MENFKGPTQKQDLSSLYMRKDTIQGVHNSLFPLFFRSY